MKRGTVVWVALVVVGALFVATAPPDPQYSVSVSGPIEPPADEPVVAFENLSEENRTLFGEALEADQRSGDPPGIEDGYVAYEGGIYQLSTAVHEGPAGSLLMPSIGGLLIIAGCVLAAYRRQ
ncbi:hypothetical protein NDI56_00545 [Haloarcula sp. S1CR25-12]|uniref:DUF7979 domain-containing protein n=1 Tax=Haloarcula saliterrae TaxID=2950534 RepID=A0ABU2F7Q6_9EURY|nr:hypothetical protein [Haloarcula sp. S1CR25-12]MDS0257890.1 hypothetical protein [Haloarcula sp. S1CR25-12]